MKRRRLSTLCKENRKKSGLGNLYAAFEELKEKLEKEGLFDSTIKKKKYLLCLERLE